MTPRRVGGLRKHPHGRVDQLEDRYLGMVEAPSSNLGTSTSLRSNHVNEVAGAAKTDSLRFASVFGSARPPSYRFNSPGFGGTLGTWHGPNHLVFADRRRLGCILRSAGSVEMSCNGGIDYLSTAFGTGRRFACPNVALSRYKHWKGCKQGHS